MFWGLRKLFYIKRVTKSEMIENFEKNRLEIEDVIEYYQSILPGNSSCHIEFDGQSIKIFHLTKNGISSNNWASSKYGIPKDSLLNELNWSEIQIKELRNKLKDANTISIRGNDNIHLGWFRTGGAMYGIRVHPNKLNESEIGMNNDSCRALFYKDNISFTFGSGAFGPECFLKID